MSARVGFGLALGLALCLVGSAAPAPAGSPAPPNVVLITIESLRPDYIASFEGERVTSPNLDALAAEAMVYTDAHSVTSWTLAAHASLFTGLYPTAHQATGPLSKLDDSYTTIAEILSAQGYATAGVVSHVLLDRRHRFDQGFAEYVEVRDSSLPSSNTIATKLSVPLQLTPASVGVVGQPLYSMLFLKWRLR